MEKKVTIVIPVYNGANYVREAIDSALAQTYKNIEILVINDGSNDKGATREICQSYGDKIRYIEKENGGVSTALNLGLDEMTGDYFSWLSHDDKYYPDKVEKQIKELEKYKDENVILYSNVDLIDTDGKKFDSIIADHDLLMKKPDYGLLRGVISGITLLIPKKAFEECGKFDTKYRCVQDYLKWYEMIKKYTFIHMEDVLAASRVHPKQVTQTSPKMLEEGNWLWSYMIEDYPREKKIQYEECEYFFYKEMQVVLQGSPYKKAEERAKELAQACLDKEKKAKEKNDITIVVRTNNSDEDLKKTITSIKKQIFKNYIILIEGQTKEKGYDTSKNTKETIKKIKTKYYTFLNSGVEADDNWLEDQVLLSSATGKGVIISDYCRPLRSGLLNNLCSFLIPIDGAILKKKNHIDYINDYQLMYDTAYEDGSFVTEKKYLKNVKEEYDIDQSIDYLGRVITENKSNSYQVATLSYDISVLYNRHANSGKKVFMYEPCDEYKELKFSRSFQMYKKYYDFKQKRKKRI